MGYANNCPMSWVYYISHSTNVMNCSAQPNECMYEVFRNSVRTIKFIVLKLKGVILDLWLSCALKMEILTEIPR